MENTFCHANFLVSLIAGMFNSILLAFFVRMQQHCIMLLGFVLQCALEDEMIPELLQRDLSLHSGSDLEAATCHEWKEVKPVPWPCNSVGNLLCGDCLFEASCY